MSVPGDLLLLVPTRSYRSDDFRAAAERLGVGVLVGSDLCREVERSLGGVEGQVSLDYRRPGRAADRIARLARTRPIAGVVAADDGTSLIAALAAERLGLPHNPPAAARRAGNKALSRQALRAAGVPVPAFRTFPLAAGPEGPAAAVSYPCVLKPLALSGSRGVIRADDPSGFAAAWRRIESILGRARAERRPATARTQSHLLVETFVPGPEVALEGILRAGSLETLALFDKPDPLDGPYFEETLYVTPSRHPPALQGEVERVVAAAAAALGLREGPVHAELRLGSSGPVVLEVAARSIGGLCARTLRFGAGVSLEEVIVTHALGRPAAALRREAGASGVMMLPIPRAGVLQRVHGLEEARAVPGVVEVIVTAPAGRVVEPLPEGDSYLGFAFARRDSPAEVERALRTAHALLRFEIRQALATA